MSHPNAKIDTIRQTVSPDPPEIPHHEISRLAIAFSPRFIAISFLTLLICMYPIPHPGSLVILAFCGLALAAYRASVRSLILMLAGFLIWQVAWMVETSSLGSAILWVYLPGTFLFIAPGLAFKVLRERVVRNERVRREATEAISRVSAEQRNELARELHDVVTHGLTIIAVHANLGKISDVGDESRQAFADIGDIARSSLEDLRRLLQTMRTDNVMVHASQLNDSHIPISPETIDLAQIIEESHHRLEVLGLVTRVSVLGELKRAPEGLRTTVARILQESVTNVVKHSGAGTECEISVNVHEDQIEMIIRNSMKEGWLQLPVSGTGLAGLQERVFRLGGTFSASSSDGWWKVHAVLPIRALSTSERIE